MPFNEIEYPSVDVTARMISRLLLQFRDSPVFNQFIEAIGNEIQQLQNAIEKTVWGRTVTRGIGEQLDAIGRIVGQPRVGVTYDVDWFTPDVNSVDLSYAWVPGGFLTGTYIPDDNVYRLMIESKVFRNFSRYTSIPEIKKSFMSAFNREISFVMTGPLQVDVIVPDDTPAFAKGMIVDFVTDNQADRRSKLPFPPTLVINEVYTMTEYLSS